jgi:lipoprotein-anchoring transpeptidase ErfK/SrfK
LHPRALLIPWSPGERYMFGRLHYYLAATLAVTALACGDGDTDADQRAANDGQVTDTTVQPASALASGPAELSPEELEAGRMDPAWRQNIRDNRRGDGTSRGGATPADSQAWEDISQRTVNASVTGLPIRGDVAGPAVARIQILLDRNRFSPGTIDGRWGKNTEKAIYWFQESNGLNATGEVDRQTLDALEQRAGGEMVTRHTLTEADISGPFESIPEDIYEQAELPCLCYESQREQLGEVFHTTPQLLEQLNPDVDLNTVAAGETLHVPAVEPFRLQDLPEGKYTDGGEVARIVVSDAGSYLHALNQAGDILYHFPSTLGADYSPSPQGDYSVESITFDPSWHYQPDLLTGVDPSEDDAVLPAGPNNAVGIVWMALSKPHYGIHGTRAPETIGYATSNGCVRLTNWDAGFLAQRVPPGIDVEFTDVSGR